jgi:hypothetical protein
MPTKALQVITGNNYSIERFEKNRESDGAIARSLQNIRAVTTERQFGGVPVVRMP